MRRITSRTKGTSRDRRHGALAGGVQPLEPRRLLSATLSTLVPFDNVSGGNPMGALVMDGAGNLYGTTDAGGVAGKGTVFEVAAGSNAATTLATFDGSNGANPSAGLAADAAGNLYGTTAFGGSTNNGTVFEIAAGSHALNTLVDFNFNNGSRPLAGLYVDGAGNLFGATNLGGLSHQGTVFELDAATHTLTTLYAFDGGANGANPYGRLIADASGNLYGTTAYGGRIGGTSSNQGTVFEIDAATHTLTTLVTFDDNAGYSHPQAGLLLDGSGNLIGTTRGQTTGAVQDYGTVFSVAAGTHALSTIGSFNLSNGGLPYGDLIADAAGNLFGTTQIGGANNEGTVFEIDAATHTLTTIASFDGATTGGHPQAGLIADANGNLFGTTESGGANGVGTVFEITGSGFVGGLAPQVPPAPPLPPPPPPTLAPTVIRSSVPTAAVLGSRKGGVVALRVTNDTASLVKGKATIDLYASSDGAIDDASTLVAQAVRRVRLAAGKSQVMALPVRLPASLATGSYTLLARVVDPSANNTDATAGPHLQVAAPYIQLSETFVPSTVPGSLTASSKHRAAPVVRITNHGNITSVGKTTLALYLSQTGEIDGTATQLKTLTRPLAVAPGRTASVAIPLTQIPALASGTYFAVVQVTDPQQQVSTAILGTPISVAGT
jgi:uncharacterized repeat protein (TIGR03803 family)